MLRRVLAAGGRLFRRAAGACEAARDLLGGEGGATDPAEAAAAVAASVAEPVRMTPEARAMVAEPAPRTAAALEPGTPLPGSVEARRRSRGEV